MPRDASEPNERDRIASLLSNHRSNCWLCFFYYPRQVRYALVADCFWKRNQMANKMKNFTTQHSDGKHFYCPWTTSIHTDFIDDFDDTVILVVFFLVWCLELKLHSVCRFFFVCRINSTREFYFYNPGIRINFATNGHLGWFCVVLRRLWISIFMILWREPLNVFKFSDVVKCCCARVYD